MGNLSAEPISGLEEEMKEKANKTAGTQKIVVK